MTHTELGKGLLDRLADDMSDLATIEAYPKVDGRNMVMVLAPHRDRERREQDEAAQAASEQADLAAAEPTEQAEEA